MNTLRPARPADEPALLALLPGLADFPVPPWRTARQIADADTRILLEALAHPDPGTLVLVAEAPDGTIAGFLFATTRQDYFTGTPHAHIEVIVVSQSARGQGLARELVEGAERWAGRRGYASITLNVFDRNTRASSVYQRLGYAPETVHYIKPLDPAGTRGEPTP